MILALSGRIKSGKSTVASIIQLLIGNKKISDENPKDSFNYMFKPELLDTYGIKELNTVSGWKQVAFATKLKQIVALLIGCTVEQLESQEFKSSPLGKEWLRWYWSHYKMTNNNNTKGKVSGYFVSEEEALDYKKNLNKDYVSIARELKSEILTPRLLMQLIGTEAGRDLIHPSIWVNGLFVDYKSHYTNFNDAYYNKDNDVYPNWIITDTRFPNELQAIKERNGIVIRINRDSPVFYKYSDNEVKDKLKQMGFKNLSNEDWVELAINEGFAYSESLNTWKFDEDNIIEHESENSLDDAEFDWEIDNNGTIKDLIEEVRKMLDYFKIL